MKELLLSQITIEQFEFFFDLIFAPFKKDKNSFDAAKDKLFVGYTDKNGKGWVICSNDENRDAFNRAEALRSKVWKLMQLQGGLSESSDNQVKELYNEKLIEVARQLFDDPIKTNTNIPKTTNSNLKLSDVLKPGIEPQMVIDMFYQSQDHSKKHLTMYLKHLWDKGYYTNKISGDEIKAIAQNDFNITLSDNRYGPPKINSKEYNNAKWKLIPHASELLK